MSTKRLSCQINIPRAWSPNRSGLEVKTFIKLMVEGCTLRNKDEVVQRNLFGAPNETEPLVCIAIFVRVDVLDDEGYFEQRCSNSEAYCLGFCDGYKSTFL